MERGLSHARIRTPNNRCVAAVRTSTTYFDLDVSAKRLCCDLLRTNMIRPVKTGAGEGSIADSRMEARNYNVHASHPIQRRTYHGPG